MLVSQVPFPLFPLTSSLPKSARLALEMIQTKVESYKYDNSQIGKLSIFLPCSSGERVLIVVDLKRFRAKLDSLVGRTSGFAICMLEVIFQRGTIDLIHTLTVARESLAGQLVLPVVPKAAKSKAIGLMQQIINRHMNLCHLVELTEAADHDWIELYRTDAAMGNAMRLSEKAPLIMSSAAGAGLIASAVAYEEGAMLLASTSMAAAVGGGGPLVDLTEVARGPVEGCAEDFARALAPRAVAVDALTLLPAGAITAGAAIEAPLGDHSPGASSDGAETF